MKGRADGADCPMSTIDRIAPTKRPQARLAGYQRWRDLLFLHWRVPADVVRHLVPQPLALDLWEDQAYVGVVPFRMEGVRPHWWPSFLAFNFLETNLRTYVHYEGRPGVYFFSLDANARLPVYAARLTWGLPYHFARMRMTLDGDIVSYDTRRAGFSSASHRVRYRIGAPLPPSIPGSIEFFLLERYLLFVERKGRIYVGQVHHAPYPAQAATVLEVEDNLMAAAGLPRVAEPPVCAHYAAGVDVEVFGLRQV
ncbi:MAG: hypothetical protein KatS3mg105_4024 [Gemmatales bacterium]|nr:MAG: hypothetical protein KatS3mg105_4024 [Gemmatales bacterium]